MHYYRKRVKLVPYLRNEADRQDFSGRPWWDWGTHVLLPVLHIMKEHEAWGTFSERFRTSVQLLAGGFAELRVADSYWDFHDDMHSINRMIKSVGHLWKTVLEACITGLRALDRPPLPPGVPGSTKPRQQQGARPSGQRPA